MVVVRGGTERRGRRIGSRGRRRSCGEQEARRESAMVQRRGCNSPRHRCHSRTREAIRHANETELTAPRSSFQMLPNASAFCLLPSLPLASSRHGYGCQAQWMRAGAPPTVSAASYSRGLISWDFSSQVTSNPTVPKERGFQQFQGSPKP
jgi:hypothetical protein